ncbi:hypothetical protein TSTA_101100 [Paecilomyces variotii No. 5]|uniref:Uncharacterized protein n=1 Tax=Byssochlamys spectabilis (strain No. 5 / NBRC 109023) TaxID=1356009 RepID=V5FRG1_BYSSN|nr:hypothetical protein TSTA_101100 [Paecilomyces variotii No. 5]
MESTREQPFNWPQRVVGFASSGYEGARTQGMSLAIAAHRPSRRLTRQRDTLRALTLARLCVTRGIVTPLGCASPRPGQWLDVDTRIQESFRPSTSHVDPTQPCWDATQSTMAHDSSPTYSISSTYSRRSKQSQGALSFLPSTVYRSVSADHREYPSAQARRSSYRGNIWVSPFRSVRKMKEPFQLVLPASPSLESNRSSGKESKRMASPNRLPTLRTCHSDQHLVAGALETFGLLPSPSLSDSRAMGSSPVERAASEFDMKSDESSPIIIQNCPIEDKSCDGRADSACEMKEEKLEEQLPESQAISDVEMVVETPTVVNHGKSDIKPDHVDDMTDDNLPAVIDHIESPPAESKTDTSPGSVGNSKKRTRSGTFSSEASWVPANLTYCETWLQGVPLSTPDRLDEKAKEMNRRKCQIVQQGRKPVDLRIDTQIANKEPVRYATLASKTKPKLVDISRRSSSATSYSVPIHMALSARRPSTPEQRPYEISAFSPDTPLEIPDSGYVTQSNRSSEDSRVTKDDDALSDIAETDIMDTFGPDLNTQSPLVSTKPWAVKAPATSSYNHYPRSPAEDQSPKLSPKLQSPPPISTHRDLSDQESLEKWWDYEWTLDQLELSVKNFPESPLTLTSPVIILLRQNNEKALLRPFRKIFPGIKEPLLGSLCASLIARNYLQSMAGSHRRNSSLSSGTTLSRLDSVPEKARATLGLQFQNGPHGHFSGRLINSRSVEVRKRLDRIIDHLFLKICGRSDETLKTSITVLTQVLETKT